MPTIEELTQRIVTFRNARDWKQFHTFKDMAVSLMLEAAEVGELYQWRDQAASENELSSIRDKLGRELSDVLYWVLLIAHDSELDLGAAFHKKMVENEQKYPVESARGSAKKYTELA